MRFVAWLAILCLTFAVGCGSTAPYVWASQLKAPPPLSLAPLEAGDRLQVIVFGQDQMSGEAEIRPAGDIVVPVLGKVPAAGLTTERLAEELTRRFKNTLAEPRVSVIVVTRRIISIGVLGEVKTPGRYEMKQTEGVLDGLARAGGLTPFADSAKIFVVRRVPGPRIRFRYNDLTGADPSNLRFRLSDGDVIVVE